MGLFRNSAVVFGLGLTAFWTLLAIGGYLEWEHHLRLLESIPIRVHVNGSRGKTGTCRLIDYALRANGLRVVTKTTGKVPVLIDVLGRERRLREDEGKDFPEGNIREQKDVVALASKQRADALVVECMAVNPEFQQVSEERLIKATLAVITNVRHDHLEVIGPDLESATKNLCRMIPKGKTVITCEEVSLPKMKREAEKRRAKVVRVDPNSVPDFLINSFPYVTFKENVALALEVSSLLGLDREKSLEGMLRSTPDYGTLRIFQRLGPRGPYIMVCAFGVNDVDSMSIVAGELARRRIVSAGPMIALFNSRDDRAQRSVEFGKFMAREMPFERMVVAGEYVKAFVRSALKAGYPKNRLVEMERASPKEILKAVDSLAPENGVVVACGNMVTESGYGIIELMEKECAPIGIRSPA